MDAQAGWYDDGSGRQRYWDGSQWVNNYGTPRSNVSTTPVPPILGYVGLGSAVVGTILACIPLTFILGVIVLVASFVVSLIGLFIKNTVKWPSIVGIILSVIGGAIGTVIVFFSSSSVLMMLLNQIHLLRQLQVHNRQIHLPPNLAKGAPRQMLLLLK